MKRQQSREIDYKTSQKYFSAYLPGWSSLRSKMQRGVARFLPLHKRVGTCNHLRVGDGFIFGLGGFGVRADPPLKYYLI